MNALVLDCIVGLVRGLCLMKIVQRKE